MKTPNIESFLKHIFQDEYEKGLDYLDLLYFEPQQKLPVIVLPQEENCTGKSTFIAFLEMFFGSDFISLNPSEIFGNYNSDWARKWVIAFDGADCTLSFLEMIKKLTTANEIVMAGKGKYARRVNFCGRFVIAGNLQGLHPETWCWVINPNKVQNPDNDLLGKMSAEIHDFIDFLVPRKRSTQKVGRLYFS